MQCFPFLRCPKHSPLVDKCYEALRGVPDVAPRESGAQASFAAWRGSQQWVGVLGEVGRHWHTHARVRPLPEPSENLRRQILGHFVPWQKNDRAMENTQMPVDAPAAPAAPALPGTMHQPVMLAGRSLLFWALAVFAFVTLALWIATMWLEDLATRNPLPQQSGGPTDSPEMNLHAARNACEEGLMPAAVITLALSVLYAHRG